MRVAVVGSIVADTIEQPDGSVAESLGGIAHTLSVLSALAGEAHAILPICRVGADCRERVERWAENLPGVSLDNLVADDDENPRVHLSYPAAARHGERVERLSHSLPPLTPGHIEPCVDADVVMVNFITGDDCTIDAMRLIAGGSERLYVDVHSLALGRRTDGVRFYRARDDWPGWLEGADVVQCNEFEAASICGLDPSRIGVESVEGRMLAAYRSWWDSVSPDGPEDGAVPPKVVALTLGERGAKTFSVTSSGVRCEHVAAPAVEVVDPTGAGDAFGAGYVLAWLAGATPDAATRAAVRTGSAACGSPGVPSRSAFSIALEKIRMK